MLNKYKLSLEKNRRGSCIVRTLIVSDRRSWSDTSSIDVRVVYNDELHFRFRSSWFSHRQLHSSSGTPPSYISSVFSLAHIEDFRFSLCRFLNLDLLRVARFCRFLREKFFTNTVRSHVHFYMIQERYWKNILKWIYLSLVMKIEKRNNIIYKNW